MAVAMFMTWEGVTKAQYEEALKLVNCEGDLPPGAVFHVAAFDNQGLPVTDIWETAEDLNASVKTRLMPGVAQIGIPTQPDIQVIPVHRLFTPGSSQPDRGQRARKVGSVPCARPPEPAPREMNDH